MADQKLTEILGVTEITEPTDEDLFYLVNDPDSAPVSAAVRKRNITRTRHFAQTVDTANVTLDVNRSYYLDLSGLTASRNLVVPGGQAGDYIDLYVSVGDDSFEAIIIGDTGVNINGVGAATEWSRLFITNEFVRLRCLSTNTWYVEVDGRIPQEAKIRRTTDMSPSSSSAFIVEYDSSVYAKGAITNVTGSGNAYSITVRRNSRYMISMIHRLTTLNDGTSGQCHLYVNGANDATMPRGDLAGSGSAGNVNAAPQFTHPMTLTAGQYIQGYGFHNKGVLATLQVSVIPAFLTLTEILSR